MSEGLDKLAGGIGKAIETVPNLYDDALKPATQELGKTLALVPRAINAALVPLRQWTAEREYKFAETEKLLAKKLEHVDEEKIVTPDAYIAVPAIQAISYSMDSEELRNLYANLLAKAMNIDTKNYVHPSFVEIIKQMTPLDATILQFLYNQPDKDVPLIDIIAKNQNTYIDLQSNIIPFFDNDIEAISISVENLSRNSLVFITDEKFSEEAGGYNLIYNNPNFSNFYNKLKSNSNPKYPFTAMKEKSCTMSTFGKKFCDICLK